MKATRTRHPSAVVLTLRGDFDAYVAPPFLEELTSRLEEGLVHVVVNLRLCKFLSSTAVGALIRARKQARVVGGDLVLSQPSRVAAETLAALGLEELFAVFGSDDEALGELIRVLPAAG